MIKQCHTCSVYYDDEYRSTICPHDAFPANDGMNNFAVHDRAYLSPKSPKQCRQDIVRRMQEAALYNNAEEYQRLKDELSAFEDGMIDRVIQHYQH